MARRQYPKGEELAKSFLNKLKNYPNFEIISQSDVCHIRIDNNEYFLYFKCVTHEGKPYPLERQRAQLPKRESFEAIKKSIVPFLFIGYDVDNDVYICWEPSKVKPRLNKKTYVSFYSRLSIQRNVVEGEIKENILTNGDKFVLFKSADILSFFQNIDDYFLELKKDEKIGLVAEPFLDDRGSKKIDGKILDINEDESLKLLIDSMKDEGGGGGGGGGGNEFGEYYTKMSLSDWHKVIREYLK